MSKYTLPRVAAHVHSWYTVGYTYQKSLHYIFVFGWTCNNKLRNLLTFREPVSYWNKRRQHDGRIMINKITMLSLSSTPSHSLWVDNPCTKACTDVTSIQTASGSDKSKHFSSHFRSVLGPGLYHTFSISQITV